MTNDNYATEVSGYSTFQDIEHKMLRAWNQYNVMSNLRENKMDGVAMEYLSALPKTDMVGLQIMIEYIKAKGYEETKREIISEEIGLAA